MGIADSQGQVRYSHETGVPRQSVLPHTGEPKNLVVSQSTRLQVSWMFDTITILRLSREQQPQEGLQQMLMSHPWTFQSLEQGAQ